jgi:hypothetical protein
MREIIRKLSPQPRKGGFSIPYPFAFIDDVFTPFLPFDPSPLGWTGREVSELQFASFLSSRGVLHIDAERCTEYSEA